MNGLTAFLIGAVCCGLGQSAYGLLGWMVGFGCALSIITVDYALSELNDKEKGKC